MFDYNGGIRGDCDFCLAPGFRYHNSALDHIITMCDLCRDNLQRRHNSIFVRTQGPPAVDAVDPSACSTGKPTTRENGI